MLMKIAILGGSFDPPHLGHILIASQVKELLGMDQVWLMPAYQHPFHKQLSDTTHRLTMTKLLETDAIKVSDFEIQHNKESYTIDTLHALSKLHPEDTFYWIMGSDQLQSFQKYKDWKGVIDNYHLIIFPREWILPFFKEKVMDALALQTIPENVIVLQNDDLVLTNVSSTLIRKRIKDGLSIDYLVPERVKEHIKKNKLYQ